MVTQRLILTSSNRAPQDEFFMFNMVSESIVRIKLRKFRSNYNKP